MTERHGGITYCTPGELCERWNIDARTLRKLPLSWIQLEPTNVRRVRLVDVEEYEQRQRLGAYAGSS